MTLDELNSQRDTQAAKLFRDCCAAELWVLGMVRGRPFSSRDDLLKHCQRLWPTLTEEDWLQAFDAHPKIGDVDSLRQKYASTKALASVEQAGARDADEAVLQRLQQGNDDYLEKFGFIFIVCATGKSAQEMLTLLEARLPNSRGLELENGAREQARITELRLEKLI